MGLHSSILIPDFLHWYDYAVFLSILVITYGAVAWGHRRRTATTASSSGEQAEFIDYMLMGRRLTLPLFTATLVATWYGGIFGVTEIAFKHGIFNFVTQGLFWYITYIIFALFLVDRIRKYQAVTLPELVGKMFGPRSAKVAAVFNFFNVVPIAYTISLGIFAQLIFGVDLWVGSALGTLFVCIYCMWSGFRSDVYSDLVQFFVMCSSVALVVAFSLFQFGGVGFLRSNLPDTHLSITGGGTVAATLVWGFIALATLVDPNFYQRCFAAKSTATAKQGILLATVVWFLFDICTTMGAMYAMATIPQAEASRAYMTYAMQVLPPGLRGFFLAGVFATIISTIDSFIFVGATTLTYDLAPKRWRGKINSQRFGIFVVGILSVVLSLMFDGSIKAVWKSLGSYFAGCLLIPMMVGHIKPGFINDRTFIFSSLAGVVGITYWRFTAHHGFWQEVDDLYIGMAVTSISILIGRRFTRAFTPSSS